ncbi:MAG: GAF domain-containing protein, partial [Chloroflexota bacterium]|nr:GAF domain-containing protein [Chloroflexota bacterium]
INQMMGEVNFFIALHRPESDTIEIPYIEDGTQNASIAPFPLGKGLTSIVIRSNQPLMLIEDTANRSRALGAIVTESGAAKSWLGVPLMIKDETIGALVVQDIEHEHRFDEDDMQLLTTLASVVAIAVRNAHLLEDSHEQAERERKLFEITTDIRHAPNMGSILQATAKEINAALGARRTHIKIEMEPSPLTESAEEEIEA